MGERAANAIEEGTDDNDADDVCATTDVRADADADADATGVWLVGPMVYGEALCARVSAELEYMGVC